MKGIRNLDGVKPGDLYTKDGTDVWRVESCCELPTITLKREGVDQRDGGAVGSPNVSEFIRLIPEETP